MISFTKRVAIFLIALIMALSPGYAQAAWTYEQLFNGLSTADLNGQDSWSGDTKFDVVSTGTPYEGAKHVSVVHNVDSTVAISRTVTGVSAGVIYVSIKISNSAGTTRGSFQIYSGGTLVGRIFAFYTGANNRIQMLTSEPGAWIDLNTSISNSTYYRIGIEYNNASQPNKYRANIDNGAFTAWYSMAGSPSWTNIDKIEVTHDGNNGSGSGTIYFDAISPNYVPGAPAASPIYTDNLIFF